MIYGGAEQSQGEEVFGIGQDIPGGVDNISLKESGGISEYGLGIPGDYPVIEHGVAVTPDDAVVNMQDEGPGEEDGHEQEEEEHDYILSSFCAEHSLQLIHIHRFLRCP